MDMPKEAIIPVDLSLSEASSCSYKRTNNQRVEYTPRLIGGGQSGSQLFRSPKTSELRESSAYCSAFRIPSSIRLSCDSNQSSLPLPAFLVVSETRAKVLSKLAQMRAAYLSNLSQMNAQSYVPLLAKNTPMSTRLFDLEDTVIDFVADPSEKLLVIFGDSGSGKSTFGAQLVRKLWEMWDEDAPIPLLIPLVTLTNPYTNAIAEYLLNSDISAAPHSLDLSHSSCGVAFNADEIDYMRLYHPFIFIMDGYDDLPVYKNIYHDNALHTWLAHTVVLCNIELASSETNYQTLFSTLVPLCDQQHLDCDVPPSIQSEPHSDSTSNISSPTESSPSPPHASDSFEQFRANFRELFISPLTPTQIESFIQKNLETNTSDYEYWKSPSDYLFQINKFAVIQELSTNPLYLRMILLALPKIVGFVSSTLINSLLPLTQYDILVAYIRKLFETHIEKLMKDSTTAHSITANSITVENMSLFYMNLAHKLMSKGSCVAHYRSRNRNKYDSENEWEEYFGYQSKSVYLIRRTPLLHAFSKHHFGFSNNLFLHYFSSLVEVRLLTNDTVFLDSQFNSDLDMIYVESSEYVEIIKPKVILLSHYDYSKTKGFLKVIAYHAKSNPNLVQLMWKHVKNTMKDQSSGSILLGSQCITILNYAGESFQGLDLRGINLHGADLSQANFDGADFTNAVLHKVDFSSSVMRNCNLTSAQMAGAILGQSRLFHHGDCVIDLFLWDDNNRLLVLGGKSVTMWDINSNRLINSISIPDEDNITCVFKNNGFNSSDLMFIGTGDGALYILDLKSNLSLKLVTKLSNPILYITIDSDCFKKTTIVVFTSGSELMFYDLNTFEVVLKYHLNFKSVSCALLLKSEEKTSSPHFIICDAISNICVLEYPTMKPKHMLQTPSKIMCIESFTDYQGDLLLCVGCENGAIVVWDTQSFHGQTTFYGEHNTISNIKHIKGCKSQHYLAVSYTNNTVCIYDTLLTDLMMQYQLHQAPVLCCNGFVRDNSVNILTGDCEGIVLLQTLNKFSKDSLQYFEKSKKVRDMVSFRHNGKEYIATCHDDCLIRVWQGFDGRHVKNFSGHSHPPEKVHALSIPENKTYILSYSEDGSTRLWDVSGTEEIWINRKLGIVCCAFMLEQWSGEQRLALGLCESNVSVIGLESGTEISRLFVPNRNGRINSIKQWSDLSLEKDYIVACSTDGFVHLWDLQSQQLVFSHQGHHKPVLDIFLLSPPKCMTSNLTFFSICSDNTLHRWILNGEIPTQTIQIEGNPVVSATIYQPQNGIFFIAVVQNDNFVRFVDVNKEKLAGGNELMMHNAQKVLFSVDYKLMYVIDAEGHLGCWSVSYDSQCNSCHMALKWASYKKCSSDGMKLSNTVGMTDIDIQLMHQRMDKDKEHLDVSFACEQSYLRLKASRGDLKSQHKLGLMYLEGCGVSKNLEKAYYWLSGAVSRDYSLAQLDVARCFEMGWGVGQSYIDAERWYKIAAENHVPAAAYHLGLLYMNGFGVDVDISKAILLYKHAANLGCVEAQMALGRYFCDAQSQHMNVQESISWLIKAADFGEMDAIVLLAELYCSDVESDLMDESKAAEYFHMAALKGHIVAQYRYAMCLLNGIGVLADPVTAVHWLRLAANAGHTESQVNLGACYEDGIGLLRDYEQAAKWYQEAALKSDNDAILNLASCYREGKGVEQNLAKAVGLYREAAENGDNEAMHNLAGCLETGIGVEKDVEAARIWHEKAASSSKAIGLSVPSTVE